MIKINILVQGRGILRNAGAGVRLAALLMMYIHQCLLKKYFLMWLSYYALHGRSGYECRPYRNSE